MDTNCSSNFSVWHAAGHCFRSLVTGNVSDAEVGGTIALAIAKGKPSVVDPRYGLLLEPLRVGPTMWALGMAYDLCHDAWPSSTRSVVVEALVSLASKVMLTTVD